MKHTKKLAYLAAALLPAALAATSSFAQSSVTMYGVIDTVVRHTNNEINTATGARGSKTQLVQGAFQGPRLGFKGVEDMGNGNSAVFQLEMGIQPDNGASDQQGQTFGRQAFVGLKNKTWGEIDFGRQYGVAFNVLGNYDPLGMGNLPENAWQLFLIGVRFDNSIKYTNSWGPWTAEVQYSFGEQAGSNSLGSTGGLGLTYNNGIFSVGVFDQYSRDANSNNLNIAGIGTSFETEHFIYYLNYFNAKRDAGFGTALNNTNALANTSLLGNVNNTLARTDNVATIGVIYEPNEKWDYTLAYMTDWVKNDTSAGNSGRLSTVYAVVDYKLSPRTDVYLSADYSRVSGGEIDNGNLTNTIFQFVGAGLGGAQNRTGVSVGMRTRF
jgi:predicted porin